VAYFFGPPCRCLSVYCVPCMFLCCYMRNKRWRWWWLHLPTQGWSGWVGLSGLENTEIVDPPKVVTNPCTNRAQRSLTLLMRPTPLPLRQTSYTPVFWRHCTVPKRLAPRHLLRIPPSWHCLQSIVHMSEFCCVKKTAMSRQRIRFGSRMRIRIAHLRNINALHYAGLLAACNKLQPQKTAERKSDGMHLRPYSIFST